MIHSIDPETGRIKIEINVPRMLIDNKSYLDFSTLREITQLSRSKLYRKLKQISNLSDHQIAYKNRLFLDETFILTHFRHLL